MPAVPLLNIDRSPESPCTAMLVELHPKFSSLHIAAIMGLHSYGGSHAQLLCTQPDDAQSSLPTTSMF
eukprot:SAG31_NODE_45591_length_258_cov_0.654088_1_plen_67_part_01